MWGSHLQGGDALPGGHLPHPHRLVFTTGHQLLPILAVRHAPNILGVSLQTHAIHTHTHTRTGRVNVDPPRHQPSAPMDSWSERAREVWIDRTSEWGHLCDTLLKHTHVLLAAWRGTCRILFRILKTGTAIVPNISVL